MPTTSTNLKEPETNNKIRRFALEIGSPLFYGLVAAGSIIILILLLCVTGVSILAYRRGCKCVDNTTISLVKAGVVKASENSWDFFLLRFTSLSPILTTLYNNMKHQLLVDGFLSLHR
jgi:hypothetical protein